MRFVRVLRVLRIVRAFKALHAGMSPLKRQIYKLLLTVMSILFLSAGLIHLVESTEFETIMGYVLYTELCDVLLSL
jgi:hypothetical protein